MNQIKLAVFDLDGVIIDSEPLHRRAKEHILSDYGVESAIDLDATVGLPNESLWAKVINENQLLIDVEQMVKLQNDLILKMMEQLQMKSAEGLVSLLKHLESKGIAIALASSSNRYFVDKVLEFLGLGEKFQYTITGDEVGSKKPDPECYTKAVKHFGLTPGEAIAVEDSASGIEAATKAGLLCVAYKNPNSGCQDLSKAFAVVIRLNDIARYL